MFLFPVCQALTPRIKGWFFSKLNASLLPGKSKMHVMYSMRAFHALGKGKEGGNLGRLNSTAGTLLNMHLLFCHLFNHIYRAPHTGQTASRRSGSGVEKASPHSIGLAPQCLCAQRENLGVLNGIAFSLRTVRMADQVFFSVLGCLKFFHLKKKKSWVSIAIAVGVCSQHIAI